MHEVQQRTPEWAALRVGKLTASRVHEAIAKTKSGWGASRANLMAELIAERLTGVSAEGFTNAAMQWGTDHEAEARAAYAFYTDVDVAEIGFVQHPKIEASGASPDGLIGDVGLVEIKCPSTATHLDTLLGRSIPAKYATQMQWQMACTGRVWCDFASFDPRLPEEMHLYVERLHRNDETIAKLEADISEFLSELDGKVGELTRLYLREAA